MKVVTAGIRPGCAEVRMSVKVDKKGPVRGDRALERTS
jgi:hypothetical protein